MLHFFPCPFCVPACQGVIVGLADTVDRHYHPSHPGLSEHGGEFWTALASCCSYRSLGAAVLPLWEVCCAVHLELPLPMVVPTAVAPYNGKVLPATLDTPTNDTIKAFERRVWRCTTTEKFSLQAA